MYLTEILNSIVVDLSGQYLGKAKDIAVALSSKAPEATSLLVDLGKGETEIVPWDRVRALEKHRVTITSKEVEAPIHAAVGESLLARGLLDKQVVDTRRAKVVRVSDLIFEGPVDSFLLVGFDVGPRGFLRRLGGETLAHPFMRILPERVVTWEDADLSALKIKSAQRPLESLHPAQIAEIVHELAPSEGSDLVESLSAAVAADTIEEVHPERQADLLEEMEPAHAADILEEMAPDEAADVLQDMAQEKAQELLGLMAEDESHDVKELLVYPEDSAGGIMTTEYVGFPPEMTAQEAIARIRGMAEELENLYYVYVTDVRGVLVGVLSLRDLIVANPQARLGEIMETKVVSVNVRQSGQEAARLVARYNLLAIPVVDDAGCLLGIVTVDDAMDLILPLAWRKKLPRMY